MERRTACGRVRTGWFGDTPMIGELLGMKTDSYGRINDQKSTWGG
jgi:hypothetical protein